MNGYQQAYINPGQDQSQSYAAPVAQGQGLRGQQSSMTNYLLGMLGKGLSVDGLRVLSDSLSNTERDGTQRYGIDTQADIDRLKNSTQLYGIDSDAASKDYGTLSAHSIIQQDTNPFRPGGRGIGAGANGTPYSPTNAMQGGYSISGSPNPSSGVNNYLGQQSTILSSGGGGGDGGGGGGNSTIKSVGSGAASTPYSSNYLRNYGM